MVWAIAKCWARAGFDPGCQQRLRRLEFGTQLSAGSGKTKKPIIPVEDPISGD
jgi:hypothetical protein